jgi:lipoprotein-releasing system ATP-binding protein
MNNLRPLIAVQGLTKSFRTGLGVVDVLKGVSMSIHSGERVAIVGASGAGKTTFMHLLGGLDRPTTGTITFDGRDIFSFAPRELDQFRNR